MRETMPLIPAIRPLAAIKIKADSPISSPPARESRGVNSVVIVFWIPSAINISVLLNIKRYRILRQKCTALICGYRFRFRREAVN